MFTKDRIISIVWAAGAVAFPFVALYGGFFLRYGVSL